MKSAKRPSEILKEKLEKIEYSEKINKKKFDIHEFEKIAKQVRETFKDEDFQICKC